MKKYILIIFILMSSIAIPVFAQKNYSEVKARVIKNISIENVNENKDLVKKIQKVKIRILEGEYQSEEYEMIYTISEDLNNISSNTELKEKDNIIVQIEEKDGEVKNINYIKKSRNQNYYLYIILAVSIILILIIGNKQAIRPMIIYLAQMILVGYIFILSINKGWNLIVSSTIISLIITSYILIKVKGINKKSLVMIIITALGVGISGTSMYLLFDIINLKNINIKIAENFINIKELFCAIAILYSCGICNTIILFKETIFSFSSKQYRSKSNNIIEGQRSLKL